MRLEMTGADPLYITAAIVLAYQGSLWWLLVIPAVITSWFVNPRWSKEHGWRFLHDKA